MAKIQHSPLHRSVLRGVAVSAAVLVCLAELHALPFDVKTTTRHSRKVVSQGPAPYYERTYSALSADSQDLTFQEYQYSVANGRSYSEPRYIAFATRDGSLDDYFGSPKQCSSNFKHVYWADVFSGGPICVSYDDFGIVRGENYGDSFNPRIGGPAGDEGRYVIFQSRQDPAATEVPNLWTYKSPASGSTQIVVHDRKWEETWLSASKCNAGYLGTNGDVKLWDISEDGKKIMFTSSAANLSDNLTPICTDVSPGVADAFIRDGADCRDLDLGGCKTEILFDTYELHAGGTVVNFLNADAQNLHFSGDQKVAVFDTLATAPIHFKPDLIGFKDIYYYKESSFKRISGSAVTPRCSADGELLPIANSEDAADGDSITPRVDSSGRYVVFASKASNLVIDETNPNMICKETLGGKEQLYFPHPKTFSFVPTNGKQQIYLYDNVEKRISLISQRNGALAGANGDSSNPWISKDAHYIIFESRARDLLNTQTSAVQNIFMYDRIQKRSFIVTPGKSGSGLNNDASITHVGPSGLTVGFQTRASDAAEDTNENGGAVNGTVQHVYLAQHNCPLDSDGDGSPDCLDLCKSDKAKTEPGQCGCGVVDLDTDKDGVADCVDGCVSDPKKDGPGDCGCGVADTDGDGDGKADCVDKCPVDPTKTSPGECGCGIPDIDSNGNGFADCNDPSSDLQPTAPTLFITKIRGSAGATYQVLATLQPFSTPVDYKVSLKGSSTRYRKTLSQKKNVVGFSRLNAGRYTLTYSISLGNVSSKQTSVTFDVPKRSQTSNSSRRK